MKKWLIIGGVVVIIIIIVLLLGVSNIGPIIRTAVNTYGPRITKTEVRLGDVDVSIFSGEAKLKDFYLGNPKGFKSPQAMKVGSIHVEVNKKSLTGDTVVIDKIEVIRPDITYEKAQGSDNFNAILSNVKNSAGESKAPKEASGRKDEGKKILIRNFVIKDGKVNLVMPMLGGRSVSAALPDIHLTDVGNRKDGVSPAEAFNEVFAALYGKITSPAVSDTLNQGLKALGTSADAVSKGARKELESLGAGAKEGAGSVTDKVKGLLGK